LQARFLAEMRCDSVDYHVCADETRSSLLEAVDAAQSRAEVAIPQVCVCG
jgi:hypothetical protein